MIRYENECVGCETCLPFCNLKKVPRLYCDKCGAEAETLYWNDSRQLCEDCIWEMHPKVEIDEE